MRSDSTLTVFYLAAILTGGALSTSCSLTATRPNQEMSNAEVALKAAKDLNADSLVPEVYRAAVENFFKAKRDYRLKNFENARHHALKATKLAEQAEFEAYRLGGATPEVSIKLGAPEGGTPDADSAFKDIGGTTPDFPPESSGAAGGVPTPTAGAPKSPGGAPGPRSPQGPTGSPAPQKQVFTTTTPNGLPPSIGSTPPATGGGPAALFNGQDSPNPLAPNKGVTIDDMRAYEKPDKIGGEIKPIEDRPMQPAYGESNTIKELGSQGNEVHEGLEPIQNEPIPVLKARPFQELGSTRDDDEGGAVPSTKEESSK